MNTQQLLCFVCAADHLNFTKAAEELYLSAPTVTHHIKNLENELNTLLFIRTSKMVKLTEAGQQFYTDAKDILSRIDIAEKKIQKIAQKDISFFQIGCTSYEETSFFSAGFKRNAQAVSSCLPSSDDSKLLCPEKPAAEPPD